MSTSDHFYGAKWETNTEEAKPRGRCLRSASLLTESGFFSEDIMLLLKAVHGHSKFMKMETQYADKLGKALFDAHKAEWVNPEMKKAIRQVLKLIVDSMQHSIKEEILTELVFDEL